MYGSMQRARARSSSRSGRRSGAVWAYGAGSLVEFPPSIGYGRLYFSTNAGRFAAISMKTGKRAWKLDLHRCVAASPAIGPHAHGTVYAVFLNQPPCNVASGGHGHDGKIVAFSAGHGKIHWQHTIGPSESSPLLIGDRLYVGDWNGDVWAFDADNGKVLWKRHVGGADQGCDRVCRRPPLRRRLRRAPVLPLDGGQAALARIRTARASTGTDASTRRRRSPTVACTSARRTARCTRSARRPESCAGRLHRRLRVRVARGVERPRARRFVQRALLRVRRGDGREALAVRRARQDLGLRDGGRQRRVLRDAEAADVRAERAHGQAALVVPRREVHARRRRQGTLFLDRLRHGLWDGPE